MVLRSGLGALLLLAAGCRPPSDYAIAFVGFPENQKRLLIEGMNKWPENTCGRVKLTLKETCDNFAYDSDICVTPRELWGSTLAYTYRPNLNQGPIIIHIDPRTVWNDGALRHVIQHELGHAFDLVHSPLRNGESVMWQYTFPHLDIQIEASQDVSCRDTAEYDRVRGETPGPCLCGPHVSNR